MMDRPIASGARCWGIFIPLAVETLWLWSSDSLKTLRDIAVRTTNRSGASTALACHHFIEQL